jgi:hypothetical protein
MRFHYQSRRMRTAQSERKLMIGKKNRTSNDRLEQVSVEVVRLSAANEAEGERVAASPFLYTRLQARIVAERERREGESWFAIFSIFSRVVPVMTLVAVFAFALFWMVSLGALSAGEFNDAALIAERETGIEHVVFADRNPLSSDEVLASILDDEREASR